MGAETEEFDPQKYLAVMSEVKRRIRVIDSFVSGSSSCLYVRTTVESACLQVRKILELVAFGSLVANKQAYSKAYLDFAKHWHAARLLRDLARVNPDFYPKPIVAIPSKTPGVKDELHDRAPDYLTKGEFEKIYEKCGSLMHARNPYRSRTDYDYYKRTLPDWRSRIYNLLLLHQIRLVGSSYVYIIHFLDIGTDDVHYYRGVPIADDELGQ